MRWTRVRVAVVLPALLACDREPPLANYPPKNLFERGAGERTLERPGFDTLWTYGRGDSVLASALQVEAFPGGDAAILDVLDQKIHRIGPSGLVWSWGRTGEGPQEIRNVRSMTINHRGEVVLADSKNRRLVWLSSTGEWLREVPTELPRAGGQWLNGVVVGIVALETGDYVLARDGAEPWVIVSEAGDVVGVVPSPWTGFGEMHSLQTHGKVTGGSADRWVFGFAVGNGFFLFEGGEARSSHPYAEHFDFPPVVGSVLPSGHFQLSFPYRPPRAAQDMTMRADTLLVLVRDWMLDRYALGTGSYIGTVVLPGPARGVAVSGDTLLVIDAVGMFPAVIALQQKEKR